MNNDILKLKYIIDKSKKICVFTGAGISCPSGIPDFRSSNGLYNQKSGLNISPEEIISHSFFVNHTDLFYKFYKDKMLYPDAKPNIAHSFFAELENMGKDISIVTQNIDGLHTLAGSSKVFEIHGSIHRNYCTKCHQFYSMDYIKNSKEIPICKKCGNIIKPNVVLYEEPLNEDIVYGAIKAISQSDTMIIIGTSLVVYPAASYIQYFRGENLVILNKSATSYDKKATLTIYDDIENIIKELKNIS